MFLLKLVATPLPYFTTGIIIGLVLSYFFCRWYMKAPKRKSYDTKPDAGIAAFYALVITLICALGWPMLVAVTVIYLAIAILCEFVLAPLIRWAFPA